MNINKNVRKIVRVIKNKWWAIKLIWLVFYIFLNWVKQISCRNKVYFTMKQEAAVWRKAGMRVFKWTEWNQFHINSPHEKPPTFAFDVRFFPISNPIVR